ncbi:hypothetical protein F5Y04DRAFT_289657 [Hypomontagnella monticulosa]|nr:hypothetical protein F5Y04DRAFT_289657 [Hypomontagnella monticulosa]
MSTQTKYRGQYLRPPHLPWARDNQRRSRARRREYVLGLERRLKLCEAQGIEATKEIQVAARRVAEENQKMRVLLNSLGFNNERIGCFLQTGSLDLTETAGLNLTENQENILRSLEPFSTSHLPTHLGLELHATPISDNLVYNDVDGNFTIHLPDHSAESEGHVTRISRHVQSFSTASSASNSLDSETREHPQFLMSNMSPDQSPDEQHRQPSLSIQLSNKPQLTHATRYGSDANRWDTVYEENQADTKLDYMGNFTLDTYSDMYPTCRMTSFFASVGYPLADPMHDSSEDLGYIHAGYHDNNNGGNINSPAFSLDTSCTSY